MNINKLKEHLENTPIEQLRKEWEEVKEWGNVDPKAEELVKLFAIPVVIKGEADEDKLKLLISYYESEIKENERLLKNKDIDDELKEHLAGISIEHEGFIFRLKEVLKDRK